MKPKNITIDDLARMVQDGFAESKQQTDQLAARMDEQFAKVDERFTQVDERFAQIDAQFTQVHQELRSIRKELEGVVYRPEFEALQDKVRDMDHLLTMLKKKTA